jgi:hypothetical protein
MAKYFKKQIVEAIQFRGDIQEVVSFTGLEAKKHEVHSFLHLGPEMIVNFGDYIVKTDSKIEILKPNLFEAKYSILK